MWIKSMTVKQLMASMTLALGATLLAQPGYTASNEDKKLSFNAKEVASGIYMLQGVGGFTGGNIGLSIGEDGVVMIDDSMPPMLDIMKTAIKSVTDKPVDFLINTHVHGDHIGNNAAMANDGAHIVAHENLRHHLLTKGISSGGKTKDAPKAMLPVITFSHSMSFHLNGEDAELIHLPKAHTDGDAAIHFKQANVIHTGDVFFNGMFPYIDINSGGSVDGYISAQETLIKLANDKTKIIPGHGPLASKSDLEKAVAMLKEAKSRIAKAIDKGLSEDDVVNNNPLSDYHEAWNWGFITTEKMTRQVYKSLKQ
ncbi:glyoxylase-like metal-dependent hydrolase (beta-lactamase superfamily II) [Pleionea mediterranea]|uniref:Glyoxylase-like metal-dependent hydrolase (Beta-lactamase superfamily II) n=2 Tax=Pleionea mediterranea TaxID=523701 RepID=A0A316FME6_9GAMM|nr:glyoxylase-like metal-dependent hydrolase (beta-lactamase superfamily II) [Pleionea mediterranea]